jgi:tripartite ATP-independent transporter DctM subunit
MTLLIIILFLLFALIGMPLAFTLGFSSFWALVYGDMDLQILPQRMMHAVDNFPLMAIPLFMLAGEIMVESDIIKRLINFSNSLVGRVHGGLAHVTIISGMVLASVTGAAVASASALGSILVPSLNKYYDKGYSSAVIASAANLGPIIPPSNAMIIYALMAGSSVSVGALFMAGVVPGIILTIAMMILSTYLSKKKGFELTGDPVSFKNVWVKFKESIVILLMPIIVVGGIVGGAFTATEGAAIAVCYSLIIGFFITKKLTLKSLPPCMFRAALISGVVGALIAFASTVTFVLTIDLIPMKLTNFIQEFTKSPLVFTLMVMVLLLIVGMFLESNAAYIMLVPLIAPIALAYGIDPIYFGFIFVLNLVIGMMTPPVGVLLFVMCGITKISMSEMVKNSIPFIILQYLVLGLCIIFPEIVTALPKALGY